MKNTENETDKLTTGCPSCGSSDLQAFYHVSNVPVNSVLLIQTKDEAKSIAKGDIQLEFCHSCGFIFNSLFNHSFQEYSVRYDPTQGFSETFNTFHKKLAQTLIEKYHLYNKNIIEIGCGKGEFLTLLCELGDNKGIGFDPAFDETLISIKSDIRFIRDYYSEKYSDLQADFVCCKMTLEHIQNVYEFVNTVQKSVANNSNTIVFFQVPNMSIVLEEIAFWDIYYEHCSYFTQDSLARLFESCGFRVLEQWMDYNDQYLMISAKIANESIPISKISEKTVESIELDKFNEYPDKLSKWKAFIQKEYQKGHSIVLWGGGSKAVAFLTTLDIKEEIKVIVDINTRKNNTFIAGTGQKIVTPEYLPKIQPEWIIVMNPIYKSEVETELKKMNLGCTVITIQYI